MSAHPTTIRVSSGPTVEDKPIADSSMSSARQILTYWREQTETDVLQTIEEFPSLMEHKSLLLDLALDEYKQRRRDSSIDIHEFCERFRSLGSTIVHSIFRALEVQDYLDNHPELLKLVADFQWPVPGDRLQGFQVVEELGRGALARVYLCHESGLGQREVVVKVARSGGYEAELLGRLDHSNIVPVYSVTNDAERYVSYICMPFRGRSTLQDLVDHVNRRGVPNRSTTILEAAEAWTTAKERPARRGLSELKERSGRSSYVDGVLGLAIQLSSALAHAHELGVYHGDLKPSNVLLTPKGTPLLIDFNLAKDWRSDVGPQGGTLAYMPPEQLQEVSAKSGDISPKYDARSEIYSFGALLFQLLTGQVPYSAGVSATDPAEAAKRLIECQRSRKPRVRPRNRCVNDELENLILKCLALDPAERPQTMHELQRRLEEQCRPLARVRRIGRSRPVLAALGLCLAALAIICLTLFLCLRQPFHTRQLARGVTLQQNGEFLAALDCFSRALESQACRRDALYERGRTYLLQGKLTEAIHDLSSASREFKDPRSAALAGYCFNLMKDHSSAISWYERALRQGIETAGLHNNLGVSYARGRSRLGYLERFEKAQLHLNRAMELDDTSLTIRGNLVMLALIRHEADSTFDLEPAVEHVQILLDALPHDRRALTDAIQLYAILAANDHKYLRNALVAIESSLHSGYGPTAHELSTVPRFEVVRREPKYAELYATASSSIAPSARTVLATFVDPMDESESKVALQ